MLVRPSRAGSVALVLSACLAACTLFTNLDGLSGSDATTPATSSTSATPGDGGDGGTVSDATRDFAAPDGSADGGADGAACPGRAGPVPVRVGAFCIDSTEVTRQQWSGFLAAAVSLAPVSLPPECAFKTSWGSGNVGAPLDAPATQVDWCDAWAYCHWAGKRLCAKVGGGPADPTASTTTTDEWYVACSRDGSRMYPYGNTFAPGRCATQESTEGGVVPVGSLGGCVGGYDGVFDMSGNAREWEDSCADGGCLLRGGAADELAPAVACTTYFGFQPRAFASGHTGFRCCGD